MPRAKRFELALAGRAASNVARRHHARLREQNRAAGQRSVILRMADLKPRDG
jgi:hypothetical protein